MEPSIALDKTVFPLEKSSSCFFNLPHCFIPPKYIPCQDERIEAYWAIARSFSLGGCDDVFYGLSNLFGPPPSPFVRLIERKKLEILSFGSLLKRVDQKNHAFVCFLKKIVFQIYKTKTSIKLSHTININIGNSGVF